MAYNNGNRATNQSLQKSAAPSNPVAELKSIASSPQMMNRFKEVIGDRAPQFLASVISAVSTNSKLMEAEPNSILASAMIAATLDLDINQSFGFAAIVPYDKNTPIKDASGNILRWEKTKIAQFQIMTKGLVQLAIRSGQYRNINVTEIYADEYRSIDILSGDLSIFEPIEGQRSRGESGMIVGYAAYIKLITGFEKTVYWSLEKIMQHAARYSKSYDDRTGKFKKGSTWADNFEAMCKNTVLNNTLSSWGILSVKMQTAIAADFELLEEPEGIEATYQSLEIERNTTPDTVTGPTLSAPRDPAQPSTHKQNRNPQAPPPPPHRSMEEAEADAELQGDDSMFASDEEAALERLWGTN